MDTFDRYRSIGAPSQGLYKDNGSRFLAFAYPVETEEVVKALLGALKKEYHDARHHCCAYRLGYKGEVWRASDDGEPSGSAGRPILGQIDSLGLSDVAVIVVRYFGGIKLGVPGLIRAYKSATADALSQASIVQKVACTPLRIRFDYLQMNEVMRGLKELDLQPGAQDFGAQACTLQVRVPLSAEPLLRERLSRVAEVENL